jgi:hypothetical protein
VFSVGVDTRLHKEDPRITESSPIFSSERILRKDYDRKAGRESQGARYQDEVIGGKQPAIK